MTEPKPMEGTKRSAEANEVRPEDTPILVDLGKRTRKQVRKLRKGKGKLICEIQQVLAELRESRTLSASSQPVIVLVREKRGKGWRWY